MTDEQIAYMMGALHRRISEFYVDIACYSNAEDWLLDDAVVLMNFTGGDFAMCQTPEQIEAYFNAEDGETLQ